MVMQCSFYRRQIRLQVYEAINFSGINGRMMHCSEGDELEKRTVGIFSRFLNTMHIFLRTCIFHSHV